MAIFHVDYTNGSNSNDGSAANPYATVVYAIETNALTTGDTVKVAGSAPVLVESVATLKGKSAADAQTLLTPTDLTGSISTGDIVKIGSPYTAFTEMVAEVTAISATEITFYESLYLPGTLGSGNYSISTQSIIKSTAGTFETFTTTPIGQVLIEGGYNAGFTSIIGRTLIERDGLGSGASSGQCFNTKSSNNNINTYQFENFGFFKWQKPINGEFGGSCFVDNIVMYMASGNMLSNYGNIWNHSGDNGNIYAINCNQVFGTNNSYFTNFVSGGYSPYFNVQCYTGQKFARFNGFSINNVVNWNGGQNSGGAKFGATAVLYASGQNTNIRGGLTFNGISVSERGGYYLGQELFFADGGDNTFSGKLTSFEMLTGGQDLDCYYQFGTGSSGEQTKSWADITMPATYNILEERLKTSNDSIPQQEQMFILRTPYDGFVWKTESGSMVTTDNVVYDTGTNSKRFYIQTKDAYATNDARGRIFSFENTGTKPASITLRCRMASSQPSQQQNVRIVPGINNGGIAYLDTPYQTVNNTTGWTDYTFNLGTGSDWSNVPLGYVTIDFTCSNSDNQTLWIDSATVTY